MQWHIILGTKFYNENRVAQYMFAFNRYRDYMFFKFKISLRIYYFIFHSLTRIAVINMNAYQCYFTIIYPDEMLEKYFINVLRSHRLGYRLD